MTASITFYNNWKAAINDAALRSATIKVTLHSSSYTFSASHSVYADLTNELSTASGYTNGGQTLTSVSWGQSGERLRLPRLMRCGRLRVAPSSRAEPLSASWGPSTVRLIRSLHQSCSTRLRPM
jgi:hypothetical protein